MAIFRWIFFLGTSCTSLFALPVAHNPAPLKKIEQIPIDDRAVIDGFFRIFLLKDAGAYTLFGDKPIAWDSYFDPSPEELTSSSRRCCLENRQMREGWEAWEKYQHLFPSSRFLLRAKRLDDKRVEILLINKSNFIKAVNRHLSDFQAILGEKTSALDLLTRYEKEDLSLSELLRHHHGLLGILLGFGKGNAWLFQKRDQVLENTHVFTLKTNPCPSPEFQTLEEERAYYQNTVTGAFTEANHRKSYKFLYLPGFLVDPNSSETKELRKKYLQQQGQIHDVYSHGRFLETTLKRFCQD